ncbi:hypothetical protein DERF_011343, partial [Dermatophagoides farinae]
MVHLMFLLFSSNKWHNIVNSVSTIPSLPEFKSPPMCLSSPLKIPNFMSPVEYILAYQVQFNIPPDKHLQLN